jgi:tetratricopeptide (TPR) repeat protein
MKVTLALIHAANHGNLYALLELASNAFAQGKIHRASSLFEKAERALMKRMIEGDVRSAFVLGLNALYGLGNKEECVPYFTKAEKKGDEEIRSWATEDLSAYYEKKGLGYLAGAYAKRSEALQMQKTPKRIFNETHESS